MISQLTVRVSFAPDALSSLVVLIVPGEVPHISLTGRANGILVSVKLPERVVVEFENEGDDLENLLYDVIVGVVGEGSDLGEEGED